MLCRDQIPDWMPQPVSWGGALEGNIVAAPSGNLVLLLRCRVYEDPAPGGRSYTLQHACRYQVSLPPGGPPQLQWKGFISMPGGGNKFNIKRDPATKLYLALTNPSIERYRSFDQRNTVTLVGVVAAAVLALCLPATLIAAWKRSLARKLCTMAATSCPVQGSDHSGCCRSPPHGAAQTVPLFVGWHHGKLGP